MSDASPTILIKNGRLIDPLRQVDQTTDLLVSGGNVAKTGRLSDRADITLDASGKIVSPGLIDLHVHKRQPHHEEQETIDRFGGAVAGSFTSVVCMPNTQPPIDEATGVEFIHRMGRRAQDLYLRNGNADQRTGRRGTVRNGADGRGRNHRLYRRRGRCSGCRRDAGHTCASMLDRVVAQHCR